jgi:hypothetical protein
MEGFLPREMVVLRVPVESCRDTTGDLEPRGDDLGEYGSTLRNWSFIMVLSEGRSSPRTHAKDSQAPKTAP